MSKEDRYSSPVPKLMHDQIFNPNQPKETERPTPPKSRNAKGKPARPEHRPFSADFAQQEEQ